MKKFTVGNVFTALSVIVAIAGLIIYSVNANGSYYHDFSVRVPLVAAIGIVVEVVGLVLIKKFDERYVFDVFFVGSGIVLMVAAMFFIAARVESAGIILGSSLEAGNDVAYSSLYQAFAGIGCFIVAMLLEGIAGLMKQNKQV